MLKPLPGVVLDTNVVLDWLVFGDPRVRPLAADIEQGRVRALGCPATRAELVHMLASTRLARWSPTAPEVLARHDRWVQSCPQPDGLPLARPRCSDQDDQVFVDLALASGARWLLSHDRALLKLRRRLLTRGVEVLKPQDWQAIADAGPVASQDSHPDRAADG
jgi:predicted nucleic acid-binding protein